MSNSRYHRRCIHHARNTRVVRNPSEAKHRPTKLDLRTSVDNTLSLDGLLALPGIESRPRKHEYQKISGHVFNSIGHERVVVLPVLRIEVAYVRPNRNHGDVDCHSNNHGLLLESLKNRYLTACSLSPLGELCQLSELSVHDTQPMNTCQDKPS